MKYKVVIVKNKIIGYINEIDEPNNYNVEVSLNGPMCIKITGESKINRNKNTIRKFESTSKDDLDFRVNKFIEEILPNVDFKIEKRFKD